MSIYIIRQHINKGRQNNLRKNGHINQPYSYTSINLLTEGHDLHLLSFKITVPQKSKIPLHICEEVNKMYSVSYIDRQNIPHPKYCKLVQHGKG